MLKGAQVKVRSTDMHATTKRPKRLIEISRRLYTVHQSGASPVDNEVW